MEKASPLRRVGKQTNSKSEKSQEPLRDEPAAPWRAVCILSFSCFFLGFILFFFYGEGGREQAPVRNIWSFVVFLFVARSIIRHEQAASLKRVGKQAETQIDNPADKCWTVLKGWVLWVI